MNKKLAIIGAGGHAKVIIEAAETMGFKDIILFDDSKEGKQILGYPVVGSLKDIPKYKDQYSFILGIGNIKVRSKIVGSLKEINIKYTNVIHKSAIVSHRAKISYNNYIGPLAVINTNACVGANNIINTGALLEHDCVIGNNNHIAPKAVLLGSVKCGDNNFIGSNCVIKNNININDDIVIGANCFINKNLLDRGTYVDLGKQLK